MIKSIENKEWVIKKTGKIHVCEVAIRVCDLCGKEEESRLKVIKANRRERGEEKDYCYTCSQKLRIMPKGPAYAKWKHGITYNGYTRITVNKNRILEHVHIMQEFLQRSLEKGETVHHIDMDKSNNLISNLYLFKSQSEHQKCHIAMENCGFKLFDKLIWFNWDNKTYVLYQTEPPIISDIIIPQTGKLHKSLSCGREYWFYNEKNSNSIWRHKRYHVLIAEALIGRPLFKNECVHHVDSDTLNNSFDNLRVVTKEEHGQCHTSLQKAVAELYKSGVVGFINGAYCLKENRNENLALCV